MEFRDAPPARRYAQIVGPTVVVIGIVGLILGDQSLLDVLNIDIAEDIIHLVTGGLLTYVASQRRRAASSARSSEDSASFTCWWGWSASPSQIRSDCFPASTALSTT
jgi:hypothetical protein